MENLCISMDKRKLFSNLQYASLLFIIVSFLLEVKILLQNIFILYLVIFIALLTLIFAYFGRKKEKGVIIASITLALFNIISYGIFGVPEHIAAKEFLNSIADFLVALTQLIVLILSLIIANSKK